MERLTIKLAGSVALPLIPMDIKNKEDLEIYHKVRKQYEENTIKLAEYEDLEEQGRLIKLPCKVGDTVWKVEEILEHTYIERLVIDRIEVNDSYIYYFADEKITGESVILDDYDFSRAVFLTQAEAEQKLKEMENK